jgi:hypothetical protein
LDDIEQSDNNADSLIIIAQRPNTWKRSGRSGEEVIDKLLRLGVTPDTIVENLPQEGLSSSYRPSLYERVRRDILNEPLADSYTPRVLMYLLEKGASPQAILERSRQIRVDRKLCDKPPEGHVDQCGLIAGISGNAADDRLRELFSHGATGEQVAQYLSPLQQVEHLSLLNSHGANLDATQLARSEEINFYGSGGERIFQSLIDNGVDMQLLTDKAIMERNGRLVLKHLSDISKAGVVFDVPRLVSDIFYDNGPTSDAESHFGDFKAMGVTAQELVPVLRLRKDNDSARIVTNLIKAGFSTNEVRDALMDGEYVSGTVDYLKMVIKNITFTDREKGGVGLAKEGWFSSGMNND